jgi:hypothetical protein
MSERSSMFLVFTGIVLCLAGVGSVEHSITTGELLSGLAVALTGLGTMACGVLAIQVQQNG